MSRRRLSKGLSVIQEVPGNDDEAEKEHLRAQREKRRLSHTPTARRRLSGIAPRAEPDKNVVEIYDRCIKLSAENKINRQNTWDLSLIDHIDDVIGSTGANTNFQKASCTLDASVKIYSYRVDSVHHDMFKVLGGLNRADQQGSDDEEQQPETTEEQEDGGDHEPSTAANRPRPRNRQHQLNSHLELRPNALVVPLAELLFEVDPMFQRTASSFDEGGAKGLLMNQLNVVQRCHIVFDFSADMDLDHTQQIPDNVCVEIPPTFLQLWSSVYHPDIQISPLTAQMRAALSEEEGNSFIEGATQETRTDRMMEGNAFEDHFVTDQFDAGDDDDDGGHHQFSAETGEQELSEQHEPSPHFDFENFENVSDPDLNENIENIDPSRDFNNGATADAGLLSPTGSRRLTVLFNETSGLNLASLQLNKNWAGPGVGTSHWRFKAESQLNVPNQDSESAILSAKLKRPRVSTEIDFRGPPIPESDLTEPPRASNVLSKTYSKLSSLNHLLPTDLHISHSVLFRLFHRPSFFLRPRTSSDANHLLGAHIDDHVNIGNFNDFDDESETFIPSHCDDNEDDRVLFASEFNFIAQPAMAEKIEIDFARSVKKVDIKAVKQCLWETLSEKTQSAPPLEIENEVKSNSQPHEMAAELQSEWPSFKTMIHSVPVPESSRDAMSVQLYFICLLHLANENDLVFKPGTMPLGDFSIGRRGPSVEQPLHSD